MLDVYKLLNHHAHPPSIVLFHPVIYQAVHQAELQIYQLQLASQHQNISSNWSNISLVRWYIYLRSVLHLFKANSVCVSVLVPVSLFIYHQTSSFHGSI